MTSLAFITPSYVGDLQQCEILVNSVRLFAPDIDHYLVIDRHDIAAFAHLSGPRTTIVPSEEVMPPSFHRLPGKKGIWLNWRTLPVRGWMAQQILKLSAATFASQDVFVMLDSDVAFVRPFKAGLLYEEDRLGLLDVGYSGGNIPTWTAVAAELLGLPDGGCSSRGHVGEMIVWSRRHLLDLHARIEEVNGVSWQIAVARKRTFSEYMLYGVFVRCLLGYGSSNHRPTTRPLVRQPWSHDFSTDDGIRDYICKPEPGNIAVMIHSKYDLSVDALRPHFEQAWTAATAS